MPAGKEQKSSITKTLQSIEDGLNALIPPGWSYTSRRRYPDLSDKVKHQIAEYQRVCYLKRKKWIKTKKTEKGLFCALTEEGRKELNRRKIFEERRKMKGGQVCLVVFDIPEDARRGRDALRQFLKNADFQMVQKSVWKSQKDVSVHVKRFIKRAGVSKWVKVFIAKEEK